MEVREQLVRVGSPFNHELPNFVCVPFIIEESFAVLFYLIPSSLPLHCNSLQSSSFSFLLCNTPPVSTFILLLLFKVFTYYSHSYSKSFLIILAHSAIIFTLSLS